MSFFKCHNNGMQIATGLMKSEGLISCTYVQKLSDKVTSILHDFFKHLQHIGTCHLVKTFRNVHLNDHPTDLPGVGVSVKIPVCQG